MESDLDTSCWFLDAGFLSSFEWRNTSGEFSKSEHRKANTETRIPVLPNFVPWQQNHWNEFTGSGSKKNV